MFVLNLKVSVELGGTSTQLSPCRLARESRSNQICFVLVSLISLPLNEHLLTLLASGMWSRDDLWQSVNIISAPSASANFFPHCGPFRDQTAMDLTVCVWSGKGGGRWRNKILFWWHSSWDLSSYASPPNGITRFSLPVYLPTLLSATWEAQTTPHQETNDNCQRLSRKTQVREMDWHLSPH